MTTAKNERKPTTPREFLIPRGNLRGPELEEVIRQLAIRCGGIEQLRECVLAVEMADEWHGELLERPDDTPASLEAHYQSYYDLWVDDTGDALDTLMHEYKRSSVTGRARLPHLFSRGDHKTA